MTIEIEIRDEKVRYDINREVDKISGLLSGKIDKYEFLTNEGRRLEKDKFTYSHLRKAFEKQIKTMGNQDGRQIEEHGKQLAESNALIKKYDYDTETISPIF